MIEEPKIGLVARFSQPALARAPSGRLGWDLVAFGLLTGLVAVVVFEAGELAQPVGPQGLAPLSLAFDHLPYYALRTVARMLAAMTLSLVFSLAYAAWAAKSRRAESVLIPLLDILQSVPILGYVAVVFTALAALFPTRAAGYELAAIFALFTSQAWNMTFSVYQALKTVPAEMVEAARAFQLSGWQRFWRLEVPFAVPGLVWNGMMSMSGGWFFVVAAEAVVVGGREVALPGIGSYIALAIGERRVDAVFAALAAMFVVILIYDQLLMRPLVAWSERFKLEAVPGDRPADSWVLSALRRSRIVAWLADYVRPFFGRLIVPAPPGIDGREPPPRPAGRRDRLGEALWYIGWAAIALGGLWVFQRYVLGPLGWGEVGRTIVDGGATFLRVMILTALAAAIWTPIGVWVGLRPDLAKAVQPAAQFLAAFPANLLFPLAVIGIVRFDLDPDIWLSPLIVLGTQWYLLFNVVAGASALPGDLRLAARNLGVGGLLWWRTVALPGILPYLITGFITAAGGAWNASVVAEAVSWGQTRLTARGLGADIAAATAAGDFPRIALGVVVMALFVTGLNHVLWRPLYQLAERRFRMG